MTKPKSKTLTNADYERLGREVEAVVVTDYITSLHSTPRQIWGSFVRGIFGGLGGVVGATVGVTVLLFLLQLLGSHLPLVGPYLKHISDSLKSGIHAR